MENIKFRKRMICIMLFFLTLVSCTHTDPQKPGIRLSDADIQSAYHRLNAAGFSPGPYNQYDTTPFSGAIRRFQRFAKLEANGILNPETWEKLQILYDPWDSGKKQYIAYHAPFESKVGDKDSFRKIHPQDTEALFCPAEI
ncbi:MAG: peptidoglycan-binding domain-containing protein, partial [Desulfococcaceae bacterium]|nr:peptidoglycan-binding domain-containing protein [Desulfococcaceae bacterium]